MSGQINIMSYNWCGNVYLFPEVWTLRYEFPRTPNCRLPCNEGWINFKVRQNKPVLQCFNLLRAPVPRYKTQCKPGQLFTYVLKTTNTGTPKEQKELSTFYNSGSGFLFVFFTLPITMLSGCSRGQDFRVLEHASCAHDYLFFRAK